METYTEHEQLAASIVNQTSGLTDPEPWLVDMLGGARSSSGVRVNTASVLALPSVWGNVQRIAGHLAVLPIEILRSVGDDKIQEKTHPAHQLMNVAPNVLQTPQVFRETLAIHTLLHGNGRALVLRDAADRPIELILLPADALTVMVDGEKWHTFTLANDDVPESLRPASERNRTNAGSGHFYKVNDADVLHIVGLSYNGIWGIDLVSFLKDTFGNDRAGQDTTSYSFRNNGRPGLIVETPQGELRNPKEREEFYKQLRSTHEGVDKAGRTLLLRHGMKASTLPMSATDSQFLESRNFSRQDIAMIFGTESLLGTSAVYKNLTERQTSYYTNCLLRWMAKIEQQIEAKLFSVNDRQSLEASYNSTTLLRGDLNSLADYTGKLRTQGAMSGNDVRRLHQMNPVDGLDDYTNPNVSGGATSTTESENDVQSEPE